MKILLFIGSLRVGGAERQFVSLANGLAHKGHEVAVVTLFGGGAFERLIAQDDRISRHVLIGDRSGIRLGRLAQVALAPFSLRALVRRLSPQVVYSMLHLTNVIARMAVRGRHAPVLVWGNRASSVTDNRRLRLTEWFCARMSRGVPLLISNSHAGMHHARAVGFEPDKSVVIENGIDIAHFTRNAAAGQRFRRDHLIGDRAFVVGVIGRLDPMKDHLTFLRSAAVVARAARDAVFVIAGDTRAIDYRNELHRFAQGAGLSERIIWIDSQDDPVSVYSALDVLVSCSSYGEGFPNVVGEAMACAVQCIVSDVGDSARVVGPTGIVFEPGDHDALSSALLSAHANRKGESPECRHRIVAEYSDAKCLERTEDALLALLSGVDDDAIVASDAGNG